MLQLIGNLVRRRMARPLATRNGQMSLVFLLLIAVALIFLAITINWGKLAQNKTQLTMATNVGTASLVSSMASYGENLSQTQLGGRKQKCGWTGLLEAIILLIIAIIILIICIVCPPAGVIGYIVIGMAIAAVVMAGAAVAIQAAYIEPKMTSLWNKMMANRSTEDRFLESGYQGALPLAIGDQEKVLDVHDFDMDGDPGEDSAGETTDKVGRFSYFYTMRLWNTIDPKCKAVKVFQDSLKSLAVQLGIEDRTNSEENSATNPCCTSKGVRPKSCETWSGEEGAESGYEDGNEQSAIPVGCDDNPFPRYPLAYDPAYDAKDDTNELLGFIGLDDSRKGLVKDETTDPKSSESVDGPDKFVGQDSEGPLFRLLWQIKDTQAMIYDLEKRADLTTQGPGCHWCTEEYTEGACDPEGAWLFQSDADGGLAQEGALEQLVLPETCKKEECCTNIVGRLQIDMVDGLSFFYDEKIDNPEETTANCPLSFNEKKKFKDIKEYCGCLVPEGCSRTKKVVRKCEKAPSLDDIRKEIQDMKGMWRSGSDLYCGDPSTPPWSDGAVPYYAKCENQKGGKCFDKHMDDEDATDEERDIYNMKDQCTCESAAKKKGEWRSDDLDDIGFQLRQLTNDVYSMLRDRHCATGNIDEWIEDARDWVEELEGLKCRLFIFAEAINLWEKDTSCAADDVWCCPTKRPSDMPDWEAAACGFATAEETASSDGKTQRVYTENDMSDEDALNGHPNVQDIIACMEVNAACFADTEECPGGSFSGCDDNCRAVCFEMCDRMFEKKKGDECEDEGAKNEKQEKKQWKCEVKCTNSNYKAKTGKNCESSDDDEYDPDDPQADDGSETGGVVCYPDLPPVEGPYKMPKPPACFTVEDLQGGDPESCMELPRSPVSAGAGLQNFEKQGCNNSFVKQLHKAEEASVNLPAKFTKRAQYLKNLYTIIDNDIQGNLEGFGDIINVGLNEGDGENPSLVWALDELEAAEKRKASNMAEPMVYAWKTKPSKVNPEGLWHVVKAEGALPKRCGPPIGNTPQACQPHNKFPWVKAVKHMGGLKRCYVMTDDKGNVGMRISRWDEESAGGVSFANLLKLWKFRTGGKEQGASIHAELDACATQEDENPSVEGAFITGWPKENETQYTCIQYNEKGHCIKNKTALAPCIKRAAEIAEGGLTSELCGVYEGGKGHNPLGKGNYTFSLKFRKCR